MENRTATYEKLVMYIELGEIAKKILEMYEKARLGILEMSEEDFLKLYEKCDPEQQMMLREMFDEQKS